MKLPPRAQLCSVVLHPPSATTALRSLRKAIEKNYCAYTALQTDPLLVNLHETPEFTQLLSDAKQCQNRFLVATRSEFAPKNPDSCAWKVACPHCIDLVQRGP